MRFTTGWGWRGSKIFNNMLYITYARNVSPKTVTLHIALANCVTKTAWPPSSFDQRIILNVAVNSSRVHLCVCAWWSPRWPRCKFGDRGPYCVRYAHDRSRSRRQPKCGVGGQSTSYPVYATDSRAAITAMFSIVAVGPGKRGWRRSFYPRHLPI